VAIEVPTQDELVGRVGSDIEDRIEGADAGVQNTAERGFAIAIAGGFRGIYAYISKGLKQLFPKSANEEHLLIHGDAWGVDRTQPVQAQREVSGTGVTSSTMPAGTEMQDAAGTIFTTDSLETVAGGVLTDVAITSVEGTSDASLDTGTLLTLVTPVTGIDSEFTIEADDGGDVDGVDLEEIEAYRLRIRERVKNPPSGGGVGDYVVWAKEVPGVTRVWEQALALGPGTVRVLFVRDGEVPIIPSAGEVSTVQDYLQEDDGAGNIIGGKAPLTATVTVAAPSALALDVDANVQRDLASGLTEAEVKANIEAELADMLVEFGAPSGTIRLSQIREAISRAAGEEYHDLTAPVADVVHTASEIPTLGTFTPTWL
jgi:uncharacterized phage protein gp47/JayE